MTQTLKMVKDMSKDVNTHFSKADKQMLNKHRKDAQCYLSLGKYKSKTHKTTPSHPAEH